MGRLTIHQAKRLTEPGRYGDGDGLYLLIAKTGTKSWMQRITIQGKRCDVGLGPFPIVALSEAREKSFDLRREVYHGGDPLENKRISANVPTLREALERVIAEQRGTWKGTKTESDWRAMLRDHAGALLDRPVSSIAGHELRDAVLPLWAGRNETARKLKRRLSALMEWAVFHKYRADNPVTAMKATLPKAEVQRGHYAAVPHQDVAGVLDTIKASTAFLSTRLCFAFTVLTACRSQEARLAEWSEINLEEKTWIIPGQHTKTGRAHRVPLSDAALAVLQEVKANRSKTYKLVFPSKTGFPLTDNTLSKMLRDRSIPGTLHGMRAAFRSWCADSNINRELAEACLAHTVKGVEGAYQRSDLFDGRRRIMEAWASYATGQHEAKVIALRVG